MNWTINFRSLFQFLQNFWDKNPKVTSYSNKSGFNFQKSLDIFSKYGRQRLKLVFKMNFWLREKVIRQVTYKFPFGLKTLLLISCLVLFPAAQIFEISYCQIKNYLILTIPRSKVTHEKNYHGHCGRKWPADLHQAF